MPAPQQGDAFLDWVIRLAGRSPTVSPTKSRLLSPEVLEDPFQRGPLGTRQLNEILISLGYDRVDEAFFKEFLHSSGRLTSLPDFRSGVDRFRKVALLNYGSIRRGYGQLGAIGDAKLAGTMAPLRQREDSEFESRPGPVFTPERISSRDTYYLGYISSASLNKKLARDPTDLELLKQKRQMEEVREIGRLNHDSYLAADSIDVYVATSMRLRHEFVLTSLLVRALFGHAAVKSLHLRHFDPTQAYCPDRVDKGLVEGLMLKRCACTVYCAQESDTLGKDSELASTLAQGKPVIAYVPRILDSKVMSRRNWVLRKSIPSYGSDRTRRDLLAEHWLRIYAPDAAWEDPKIRRWLDGEDTLTEEEVAEFLVRKAQAAYEKRATVLKEVHPLGLQVNINTGVANGVLVARTVDECAILVRGVITRSLDYTIEEKVSPDGVMLMLRERISGSIYRVMTGDPLLTNSFWAYYK